jgi:hypothetical protein
MTTTPPSEGTETKTLLHDLFNELATWQEAWRMGKADIHAHTRLSNAIERSQFGVEQIGIVINGLEFVPKAIMDQHIPFAVPPDTDVQAVYRIVEAS